MNLKPHKTHFPLHNSYIIKAQIYQTNPIQSLKYQYSVTQRKIITIVIYTKLRFNSSEMTLFWICKYHNYKIFTPKNTKIYFHII